MILKTSNGLLEANGAMSLRNNYYLLYLSSSKINVPSTLMPFSIKWKEAPDGKCPLSFLVLIHRLHPLQRRARTTLALCAVCPTVSYSWAHRALISSTVWHLVLILFPRKIANVQVTGKVSPLFTFPCFFLPPQF